MKALMLPNGDQVPALGLGTWKSKPGQVYEAVKEAIKVGYRHIDCAPIYGNENEVGNAIKDCLQEGMVKRSDLWITSKLWNNAHAREDVMPALKKTLSDLQLDYLDLFLIHWPISFKKDSIMAQSASDLLSMSELPHEHTWEGMEQCVKEGLTRYIGVSNFGIKNLQHLLSKATIVPIMNQVEAHPYFQQKELLDFCQSHKIHLTAYSPLGSIDRSSALKAENEPILLEDPLIEKIAQAHQVTPAQVLISWALQRDTVVIPKSVNPARIKQNFEASMLILTAEDMQAMEQIDKGFRYVNGSFFVFEGGPYSVEDIWA